MFDASAFPQPRLISNSARFARHLEERPDSLYWADHDLASAIDLRLPPRGRFFDAHFRNTGLNPPGHPAQGFDLLNGCQACSISSCVSDSTLVAARARVEYA